MAQHHLHSKEARNFAPFVLRMSENEAENLLAEIRWGSPSMQVCPWCGVMRKHYRKHKRRRWCCADCNRDFSVTSHSLLHGHKLSFKQLVLAALMFANKVKGSTLLLMSRDLGITPKTCQVLAGKIRESFLKNIDLAPLDGIVHMDGGYFCGKPRKPNCRIKMPADAIAKRFGRKKIQNTAKPWIEAGMTRENWERRADKRTVISICSSAGRGNGSARTMAFVCRSENAADVKRIAEKFITPGSIVMTDEGGAYGALSGLWEHYWVPHAERFSTPEGVSNNMAETFNSRLRRGEYGAFHGFRPKYLQDYAAEFAWRETNRKLSQRDQVLTILRGLLTQGKSEWWRGYWQGHHRKEELGLDYFLNRLT
ncbi:IS1595 family transposase [Dyella sedimenti]|uniref:IS1595 family transposase n=1 Tax=Dyella sedimenti TaxID=2919947 RepID=UPI001FA957FC|nr:IS1595 family transposase [Dyella sedimenti]